MNEIAKRQNENKHLMFQFSARTCFNHAERANYLVWIVCLLGCVYGVISSLLYQNVVGPLTSVLVLVLQNHVQRAHSLGAAFREYVDYSLFHLQHSMTFNGISVDVLCGKARSIYTRNKDKAEEQFRNTGKDNPRGVRDWYDDINEITDHNEAVFNCQKQNRYWDRRISEVYLNVVRYVIAAVILSAFLAVFKSKGFFDYLCSVVFPFTAVIFKAALEYRNIKGYNKRSIELDTLIQNHSDPITDEEISRIQSVVDARRNMLFIVPNILHKILSSRIHDEQKIINQ